MNIEGIKVCISFLKRTECLILSKAFDISIIQVKTSEPLSMKCVIVSNASQVHMVPDTSS